MECSSRESSGARLSTPIMSACTVLTTSGGSGARHTPTTRFCDSIFLPLQFVSKNMPDILGLLSKLFSNEPLERLMFMVLIFALALIFIPDSVHHLVNEKVGIPYAYQIVIFAASFVLAVNIQRAYSFIRLIISARKEVKREKAFYRYVNQVIDSFNDEQVGIIATALSRMYPVINASRNDPNIEALVKLRVLIPAEGQLLPHENPISILNVHHIFWDVLVSRWNGYTGKIDPITSR